jgi:hypothetical protein
MIIRWLIPRIVLVKAGLFVVELASGILVLRLHVVFLFIIGEFHFPNIWDSEG